MSPRKLRKLPRADWRLVLVFLILASIAVFILIRSINLFNGHTATRYEKILSGYYRALAGNNPKKATDFTIENFSDESAGVRLIRGRYDLFSYHFSEAYETNGVVLTNAKIFYSLSTASQEGKVSYLNEAYFTLVDDRVKLEKIKNLYVGKVITRR